MMKRFKLFLERCPVIICEYNYRHHFYTSSLCKKMSPNIGLGWCGRLDERIGSARTWRKWKTPAEVMTRADGLVWLGWTPVYSFWAANLGSAENLLPTPLCKPLAGADHTHPWAQIALAARQELNGVCVCVEFVSRWSALLKATT